MLKNLIMDSVGESPEWMARGGNDSSMNEMDGNLIVRTTRNNHRQLVALLREIRESGPTLITREMRHEEVIVLLRKADALRLQQHYREALRLADQALDVDPDHPWARAMKQVIEDSIRRSQEARPH